MNYEQSHAWPWMMTVHPYPSVPGADDERRGGSGYESAEAAHAAALTAAEELAALHPGIRWIAVWYRPHSKRYPGATGGGECHHDFVPPVDADAGDG